MLCNWSINWSVFYMTVMYCRTYLKSQKFFVFSVEPSVSQLSPWGQTFITYYYYVCYVLCIDQNNNLLVSFHSFCRAQRSYLWPWSQFDLTVDGTNCPFFCRYELDQSNRHAIVLQTWNNIIQCSRKTTEGNDCGWITAPLLESCAFPPMFVPTEHWIMFYQVCNMITWWFDRSSSYSILQL